MNADTELDLDTLHTAIASAVSAAMPQFRSVQSYPTSRSGLPLPAVLVELEDFEAAPDADPGTEQLAVVARFRAHVILGMSTPDLQRQVRKAATSLAHVVHLNRWGLPVEPARVTLIAPDPFDPALDQYEVWAVEWEQVLHLGASVFEEGVLPSDVLVGIDPETGPDHVADYQSVEGGA
ncbi:hypothetical protein [Limimaricola sp. AA108-03]|uniref:hypothetical protein n=1 Tax=Limimaricola sp. AA108-03 TaxID=3425945 RepID=UPI003D78B1CF